ncbi:transposon Tf2-9 polyprotein [Trichonephila inaurata madagascariensis]|uniref:Transposon Tf2-9 polyprotein n=1 Tax=Trichonephila inaurata madagascariensis TaxID=2747483 RepID=A0A8X6Y7I8_9ARAC|nr:transposon Tf2-9 polyprotein [Trichonephila inaurata madagascariensis]
MDSEKVEVINSELPACIDSWEWSTSTTNSFQIVSKFTEIPEGHKKNRTKPLFWTEESKTAFTILKDALCKATFLVHPAPDANLSLVTDASDTAFGAVLQQEVNELKQPLSFFSRSLTPSQRKHGVYDRAIYLAVKHFKYILKGRPFIIFTDHKPLTFALQQDLAKANPRQFHYLDFIGQYTTNIQFISGGATKWQILI